MKFTAALCMLDAVLGCTVGHWSTNWSVDRKSEKHGKEYNKGEKEGWIWISWEKVEGFQNVGILEEQSKAWDCSRSK